MQDQKTTTDDDRITNNYNTATFNLAMRFSCCCSYLHYQLDNIPSFTTFMHRQRKESPPHTQLYKQQGLSPLIFKWVYFCMCYNKNYYQKTQNYSLIVEYFHYYRSIPSDLLDGFSPLSLKPEPFLLYPCHMHHRPIRSNYSAMHYSFFICMLLILHSKDT